MIFRSIYHQSCFSFIANGLSFQLKDAEKKAQSSDSEADMKAKQHVSLEKSFYNLL